MRNLFSKDSREGDFFNNTVTENTKIHFLNSIMPCLLRVGYVTESKYLKKESKENPFNT